MGTPQALQASKAQTDAVINCFPYYLHNCLADSHPILEHSRNYFLRASLESGYPYHQPYSNLVTGEEKPRIP